MNPLFYRPIKTDKLTQAFGESGVCAKCLPGGFPIRPFKVINKTGDACPPGYKDFYRIIGLKGHNGGDWAAWKGEPAYHCGLFRGTAKICKLRDDGTPDLDGGLNVISQEPILECTEGCPKGTKHYVMIRYAHGDPAVKDGDLVVPGAHVMAAGNYGSSSGVHVHWAPKWCDPIGKTLHTDNGYQGAFDYNPLFKNTFVVDFLNTPAAPIAHSSPAPQEVPLGPQGWLNKAIFSLSSLIPTLN